MKDSKSRDRAKEKRRLMNIDAHNPNAITAFTIRATAPRSRQQCRPLSQLDQSKRSECDGKPGTNN